MKVETSSVGESKIEFIRDLYLSLTLSFIIPMPGGLDCFMGTNILQVP